MTSPGQVWVRARRTRLVGAAGGLVAAAVVLLAGCGTTAPGPTAQPAPPDMNQQAQMVMPFDLTKTTHTFTKTPVGGVEQVVANDPADGADIAGIRGHLADEASKFSAGDYSDPARIHGADMPGLAQLHAGAARVAVRYEALPAGAHITYSSADPALAGAVHAWFDRQTADHGMPGMGG